jgi:hypothetical protein
MVKMSVIAHTVEYRLFMSFLSVNKAQQLLQGLQATGNEDQQLSAVIEMCQVIISSVYLLLSTLFYHYCNYMPRNSILFPRVF